MNLPNKLTVMRIGLSFVFIYYLFIPGIAAKITSLIIFIIASVTDFLDGYIARKYQLTSDLGKLLDPIADKVLVLSAFLSFVGLGLIPAWMVMVIILRELVITGIRFVALSKGKVLAASRAGKHKTVSQIVSIVVILLAMIAGEVSRGYDAAVREQLAVWTDTGIYVMMLITIAFTLISGISYMVKNRAVFLYGKNS